MTEETYGAFHRLVTHMLADLGMDAQYDLKLIGHGLGLDEARLQAEFPELYAEQEEEVEFTEEEEENKDEQEEY